MTKQTLAENAEEKLERLINEFDDYIGASDDMRPVKILDEIGQIEHTSAAKFLMNEGTPKFFVQIEPYHSQSALASFGRYLINQKLPQETLREIAGLVVGISQYVITRQSEIYGFGSERIPGYATEIIKTLVKRGNQFITEALSKN